MGVRIVSVVMSLFECVIDATMELFWFHLAGFSRGGGGYFNGLCCCIAMSLWYLLVFLRG